MAGYNSYLPYVYPNSTYSFGGPAPTQSWNQLGTINWVQGEAGARSVPIPAGQKALLMDSETNVFYIKSSDSSGMPLPLRTFEYKEVVAEETHNSTAPAQGEYVTKEELEQIIADLKPKKEEKSNEFII